MRFLLHDLRPLANALLLGSALMVSCRSPVPEEPVQIETVDIEPAIDAELSTEGDLQAVERVARISGLLPDDLPGDVPLFAPSSAVGFSSPEGGRAWVELDAGPPPAEVRRWLGERLAATGWTVGAIGDDRLEAHKDGRRVAYRLTDLAPGTRLRLEYPPRP